MESGEESSERGEDVTEEEVAEAAAKVEELCATLRNELFAFLKQYAPHRATDERVNKLLQGGIDYLFSPQFHARVAWLVLTHFELDLLAQESLVVRTVRSRKNCSKHLTNNTANSQPSSCIL